jgi:CRISPR-associated protein Cmr4
MADPFVKKTYYAITLDPVHVGTGGYRLGRVDNTITREPGTNLPKIPGSSISGVARAYTAMAIQSQVNSLPWEKQGTSLILKQDIYKQMKYQRPKFMFLSKDQGILVNDTNDKPVIERDQKDGSEIYYSCAGKGIDEGEGHCGEPDCEVCVPFGFSKGKGGSSFQGLAQFFDARILFFPVHSMIGPVWVTSPCILNEHGLSVTLSSDNFKSFGLNVGDKLNFGWLMLAKDAGADLSLPSVFGDVPEEIRNRLLLVSDKLFPRIVNDNLEVRTSVAIDPATGAAESGALYTYEAIPRTTVMWFDIVYNRPEFFRLNSTQEIRLATPTPPESYTDPFGRTVVPPDQIGIMAFNVEKGLRYIESLGVGGMGTRGMGRMRILNLVGG